MLLKINESIESQIAALIVKYGKLSDVSTEKCNEFGIYEDSNKIADTLVAVVKHLAAKSETHKSLLCDNDSFKCAQVDQWLSFALTKNNTALTEEELKAIADSFKGRYLVGNEITAADIAVYPYVRKTLSEMKSPLKTPEFQRLLKWFESIQNHPEIQGAVEDLGCIDVSVFKTEAKPAKEKKEKKEKSENSKKNTQPEEPERPLDDAGRLEFRVGQIVKVWKHPNADKLYCEEIDVGEDTIRQIASGLREHMCEEEMLNAKVVVIANMKSKKLKDFPSHGMVMCTNDGNKTEFVRPPPDTPVGERVMIEGFDGEPDKQLNTKTGKDPWAVMQPFFKTNEDKQILYKEHKWMTSKGACFCDTVKNGAVS